LESEDRARRAGLRRIGHERGPPHSTTSAVFYEMTDYVLHTWDLARALGGDETLPDQLAVSCWSALEPLAPFIRQTGVFGEGPSGTVEDDAPLQFRLLDLSGGRP
jgi:hypothetical protein